MDPHSIVIVSLHTPKEKVWGELLAINPSGITLRCIDLNSFDHFIRQINEPDGDRMAFPTLLFPRAQLEATIRLRRKSRSHRRQTSALFFLHHPGIQETTGLVAHYPRSEP